MSEQRFRNLRKARTVMAGNTPPVDYQLGALGINWDRAQQYKSDAMDIAARQHQMNAQAKIALFSDKAEPTGYRLCYDCGIDGMDAKYWVEKIPFHHVDWDMTEDEWEELRNVLQNDAKRYGGSGYLKKLFAEGKLGTPIPDRPAVPPSAQFPLPSFPYTGVHNPHPLDAHDNTFKCDCGTVFVSETGFARCPNNPYTGVHRVGVDATVGGRNNYRCSCGHRFISLHNHRRVMCPLDPAYRVCR